MTLQQIPTGWWTFFAWRSSNPASLLELFELSGDRLERQPEITDWAAAFHYLTAWWGAEDWSRTPFIHAQVDDWQLLCSVGAFSLCGETRPVNQPLINWTIGERGGGYTINVVISEESQAWVRVKHGRVSCLDPPDPPAPNDRSLLAAGRRAKDLARSWMSAYGRYPYRSPFRFRFQDDARDELKGIPVEFTVYDSVERTMAGLGVPSNLWPDLISTPELFYAVRVATQSDDREL